MAEPHFTPTAALMDRVLRDQRGTDLVSTVLEAHDAGRSWREIALELKDVTGIRVSHESVRGWAVEWRHGAAA